MQRHRSNEEQSLLLINHPFIGKLLEVDNICSYMLQHFRDIFSASISYLLIFLLLDVVHAVLPGGFPLGSGWFNYVAKTVIILEVRKILCANILCAGKIP